MDLNIKSIRIFVQVMKDLSFSKAARTLKLTQPTISQQIAKLEEILEAKLFERVGHDIIPTESAKEFLTFGSQIIEQTDDFHAEFKSRRAEPKGLVRYAMPESCQWTPHYKKIMAQLTKYPEIEFEIEILSNDKIINGILSGYFDFGFVTGEKLTPELKFEKFSDEKYSLVAKSKDLFKAFDKTARIVSYPGWELFFMTWAKSHGYWSQFKSGMKKPIVQIGTLAGAIHAVKEGVGVAVIPTHCIMSELESQELYEFNAKKAIASCPIFLSRKIGAKLTKRTDLVIELLRQAKLELG